MDSLIIIISIHSFVGVFFFINHTIFIFAVIVVERNANKTLYSYCSFHFVFTYKKQIV